MNGKKIAGTNSSRLLAPFGVFSAYGACLSLDLHGLLGREWYCEFSTKPIKTSDADAFGREKALNSSEEDTEEMDEEDEELDKDIEDSDTEKLERANCKEIVGHSESAELMTELDHLVCVYACMRACI